MTRCDIQMTFVDVSTLTGPPTRPASEYSDAANKKHNLMLENVAAVQVVTAVAQLSRASAADHDAPALPLEVPAREEKMHARELSPPTTLCAAPAYE